MAFAIGHVSGCHLNPAVTLGLVVGGRHPAKEMLPYWIVQVLGGIAAAWVLSSPRATAPIPWPAASPPMDSANTLRGITVWPPALSAKWS
jgi:hypothetical protein